MTDPRIYSLDPNVPGTIPVLTANCWEPPGTATKRAREELAAHPDRPVYLRNFAWGADKDGADAITDPMGDPAYVGDDEREHIRREYWEAWTAFALHGMNPDLWIVQAEGFRNPWKWQGGKPPDRYYRGWVNDAACAALSEYAHNIYAMRDGGWDNIAAYELANYQTGSTDSGGWLRCRCAPGDIDSPSAQLREAVPNPDGYAIRTVADCSQARVIPWIGPGGIAKDGSYWSPPVWPEMLRNVVQTCAGKYGVSEWILWRPNGPKDQIDRDMATAAEIVNKYGRTA